MFTALESFQGQKRPSHSSPGRCLLLPEKRPEERGATGDLAPASEAVAGPRNARSLANRWLAHRWSKSRSWYIRSPPFSPWPGTSRPSWHR